MSRVLNVTPDELDRAALPLISAATGRRSPRAVVELAPVELIKLDRTWFFTAVFLGPVLFLLIDLTLVRRRLRLPLEPEVRTDGIRRRQRGLAWLRAGNLGWGAFLAVPALFWHEAAAGVCLGAGVAGWLAGLYGAALLCRHASHLPALLEVFDQGRVAVELPSWWVADEYRKALGHPPQGQPKDESDQEAEDAMWEAKGKPADWDEAPPHPPQ